MEAMEAKDRYAELEIRESLKLRSRYPAACKELAYILRHAYSKAPKLLQSFIFEDVMTAFRLLPSMSTQAAVSSANLLLQNAEFALPKQKKVSAVAAFKKAMVTSKRQSKSQPEEEGSLEFPEDILIHVFSFLDLQSLISAGLVCRLWSSAASYDHLWESLYVKFFGLPDKAVKENDHTRGTRSNTHWRDKFKSVYKRGSSKEVSLYRGFCSDCLLIFWLTDSKCYRTHPGRMCRNPKIIPISMHQIVDYLLDDSIPSESSDSDSDSDDLTSLKLWVFPRR